MLRLASFQGRVHHIKNPSIKELLAKAIYCYFRCLILFTYALCGRLII